MSRSRWRVFLKNGGILPVMTENLETFPKVQTKPLGIIEKNENLFIMKHQNHNIKERTEKKMIGCAGKKRLYII